MKVKFVGLQKGFTLISCRVNVYHLIRKSYYGLTKGGVRFDLDIEILRFIQSRSY